MVPRGLVIVLQAHAHTADMKAHIPLLYPQTGQVRTGMVRKPKQENRGC